jgi:hypothetical protein
VFRVLADFQISGALHVDDGQRVRQLVAGASGADHVLVVNAQLFTLDEVPGLRKARDRRGPRGDAQREASVSPAPPLDLLVNRATRELTY